ncbi:MAG: hypothetical protein J7L71_03100 [Spirochaetaceae bacterium]|nr:hypothetical protein [Spirochaetaceae bacterium]
MEDQKSTATKKIIINSIERFLSSNDAVTVIKPFIENYIPKSQKMVFYPYYWVFFHYTVNTIIGKSRIMEASCLVDMINNIASTTDRFEKKNVEAVSENILTPSIPEEDAFNSARTYLTHASILKRKALLVPDVQVIQKELIYKPFWIIKCTNRTRENFNIMVDAVTGKYQTL